MGEGTYHGVVRDYLERIHVLHQHVARDVLELYVIEKASHLLPELGRIIVAVVFTPH